jgi:hypothetical protein
MIAKDGIIFKLITQSYVIFMLTLRYIYVKFGYKSRKATIFMLFAA